MAVRVWTGLDFVLAAGLARLIPHPANVTPIIAMALFSGAALTSSTRAKLFAVAAPLAAMLISDFALGLHGQMVSVYGAIVLISMIGFALSGRQTARNVVLATLASSILFFVITNFTVWLSSGMYAHTSSGLLECYLMALPFLRNAVVGDLFFSGVLFGAWALLNQRVLVNGR